MRFTRVELSNWRNFRDVKVDLQRRVFLVGPNASGKSYFLDVFRFLRDVADPQGGLQRAIELRGGVSRIRSLHARQRSDVRIKVEVDIDDELWSYTLAFKAPAKGPPRVVEEIVTGPNFSRTRPDPEDEADADRLTQTHLEQVNANREFRVLATALASVNYLHVVPQLIREPDRRVDRRGDPYGSDFLQQLLHTSERQRKRRLKKVERALRVACPQLTNLDLEQDSSGAPHLRAMYEHWRPRAGWQTEGEFSDGTLRLIGLLWAVLDGTSPLLLEEPELSLHAEVVRQLPRLIDRVAVEADRQVMISTHSADLLSDPGIAADEVLLLIPARRGGTEVNRASDLRDVRALLEKGLPVGEAVMPKTAPRDVLQLTLWE